MATKFTLQPKPTFKANVSIPRAGDEDGVLTFTFNHKPLKELADLEKLEGKPRPISCWKLSPAGRCQINLTPITWLNSSKTTRQP